MAPMWAGWWCCSVAVERPSCQHQQQALLMARRLSWEHVGRSVGRQPPRTHEIRGGTSARHNGVRCQLSYRDSVATPINESLHTVYSLQAGTTDPTRLFTGQPLQLHLNEHPTAPAAALTLHLHTCHRRFRSLPLAMYILLLLLLLLNRTRSTKRQNKIQNHILHEGCA